MTVAERIEQRIQTGSLPKPIPPWAVTAKRVCVWGGLGLTVAAGAASTAVSWWLIADPNGALSELRASDVLRGALDVLPVVWIALSLGSGLAAYWLFAHTAHGYRHRRLLVCGAVGVGLLAFGGALYAIDLSDSIEEVVSFMPGYTAIQAPRRALFMRPEQGRIVGRIETSSSDTLRVIDTNQGAWQVTVVSSTQLPVKGLTAILTRQGGCVRIFGQVDANANTICAQSIKPCPRAIRLAPATAKASAH